MKQRRCSPDRSTTQARQKTQGGPRASREIPARGARKTVRPGLARGVRRLGTFREAEIWAGFGGLLRIRSDRFDGSGPRISHLGGLA